MSSGNRDSTVMLALQISGVLRLRHYDATNRCNTSPRQNFATEFCRCDLSHEFKPQRQNNRKQPCRSVCVLLDKSLRQNLNQPMRKYQLVSGHVKFELIYISSPPKSRGLVNRIIVLLNSSTDWMMCTFQLDLNEVMI